MGWWRRLGYWVWRSTGSSAGASISCANTIRRPPANGRRERRGAMDHKRSRNGSAKLEAARSAVLRALDETISAEIVELACDLVNIASPTGEEHVVGDYLGARFRGLG